MVTAFLLGTIVWYHANPALAQRCGFSCYVREPGGPVGYVLHGLLLQVHQATIAHTLPLGYFRPVWNGSLWTLYFEFLCYFMLAVLSVLGLLDTAWPSPSWRARWVIEIIVTTVPSLNQHFGTADNWDLMNMLTFVPIFLGGSLLFLYRDKIPDSGVLALVCTALVLLGLVVPLGNSVPRVHLDQHAPLCRLPGVPTVVAGHALAPPHGRRPQRLFLRCLHLCVPRAAGAGRMGGQPLGLLALHAAGGGLRLTVRGGELVDHRETRAAPQDDAMAASRPVRIACRQGAIAQLQRPPG